MSISRTAGKWRATIVHVRRQVRRRVGHRVEVPLHVRPQDPLEVVADAHVEDHAGPLAGEAERAVEGVDQHPGPQVLVERLVDLELLRPLDVVALVRDVDAGLVDVELVERLDRLELDQPGARRARRRRCSGPSGCAGRRRRPNGVSSSTPVLAAPEAVVRAAGRRTPTRGTLKSEPFCSSSVKTQSVSCSIERGWKRSDIGCSRRGADAGRGAQRRACRRAACSRALARISSASTRVGRPSAKTTSPSIVDPAAAGSRA